MDESVLQIFAIIRIGAMIPLLALLIYALILPNHCNYRPLVKSLIVYYGLTACNTYIRYYVDEQTSRSIIAIFGTLALLGVVLGVVLAVRSRET